MVRLVGIDEAGYGPLLGPLVVTAAAFDLPHQHARCCLWRLLQASVGRSAVARQPRLPVADSKKLYRSPADLARLERTALAFLQLRWPQPASLRQLLQRLCPAALQQLSAYPWYSHATLPLPVAADPTELATRANSLRRDLREHGVDLADLRCHILLAGHFNQLVGKTRNKAAALFGITAGLIQQAAQTACHRPVRIAIDKQGGRNRYAQALMTAFDDCGLTIIEQSPARSAYTLIGPARNWQIEFVRRGESAHLPIALASILSKYLRELFMICFNRFWQRQMPALRPTAGYYRDARRFLRQIGPQARRTRIDQHMLVRQR